MNIREIEIHTILPGHAARKQLQVKINDVLSIDSTGNYSAEVTELQDGTLQGIYKIDTGLPIDIIRLILQESKVKNILVFCPDENVEERISRT